MLPEAAAWLIIGLPLLAGVLNISVLRPWRRSLWQYAGYVSIAGTGAAFVLSLIAVNGAMGHGDAGYEPHAWFTAGALGAQDGFHMTVGILLDPLSAVMAAVVSGVSTVVQVFSLGYMRKDADDANGEWSDYPRYFTYMALFTTAMLGAGARVQPHPTVRVLGTGGTVLLPAHRVLVPPSGSGCRCQEGVHRHEDRRLRFPARHPVPVPAPG